MQESNIAHLIKETIACKGVFDDMRLGLECINFGISSEELFAVNNLLPFFYLPTKIKCVFT